jgi:hypothetical protein
MRRRLHRWNGFRQQSSKGEQGPQPHPPGTWTNIGPAHIASDGCGYASENSGRTVALAVDPVDASHWLITADSGGIWETTDAGGTWSPRTDDQSALRLNSESAAIAFAPSDGIVSPSVVYASAFAGLLKSTDRGTTWTLVEKAIFGGRGARAFLVSPTDPNIVVAAVDTLFGSDASYGIYQTTDGGLPGRRNCRIRHLTLSPQRETLQGSMRRLEN